MFSPNLTACFSNFQEDPKNNTEEETERHKILEKGKSMVKGGQQCLLCSASLLYWFQEGIQPRLRTKREAQWDLMVKSYNDVPVKPGAPRQHPTRDVITPFSKKNFPGSYMEHQDFSWHHFGQLIRVTPMCSAPPLKVYDSSLYLALFHFRWVILFWHKIPSCLSWHDHCIGDFLWLRWYQLS